MTTGVAIQPRKHPETLRDAQRLVTWLEIPDRLTKPERFEPDSQSSSDQPRSNNKIPTGVF